MRGSSQSTVLMRAGNMSLIKYHIHTELAESGTTGIASDVDPLGKAIERRLNRMERVTAVYLGRIQTRLPNGLQVVFDTAEAAVLGACGMQHRCAALPALSGHSLALRIAIHQGIELKRAQDGADSAMEIASLLAVVDDGIVLTSVVYSALKPELSIFAHPLSDSRPPIAAYAFDWHGEVPTTAYGGTSGWPTTTAATPVRRWFVLRHNLKTIELNDDKPIVTIGRDPQNDLVIAGNHVSRQHCRIDRGSAGIVLTDASANGTFVSPDHGDELRITNASFVLHGRGVLMFGRQCKGDRRGGVMYESFPGD